MQLEEIDDSKLLVLEPLYGGCHKRLIDNALKYVPSKLYTLVTMPPKKWNWRSRISAVFMSENIPLHHAYQILFCSSVLPLAELIGLRPDLAPLYKVVYFHENQIAISITSSSDIKHEFAYNDIKSCLAADQVLFNSNYNQRTFIKMVNKHIRKYSDFNMHVDLQQKIKNRSQVVYFPIDLKLIDAYLHEIRITRMPRTSLHIVWPHRWEFDRPPQMFYRVIERLENTGYEFKVVMIPQSFIGRRRSPDALMRQFQSPKLHYLEDSENDLQSYYTVMKRADVILSTAETDFFANQIVEGMYCDLIPVLPRLPVYTEIFKNSIDAMYENEEELFHILADLCSKKQAGILNDSYRHLCYTFESTKWFQNLLKILQCEVF